MEIRLLLRVHYQVSRPGVFSLLLDKCTSPQQSNYPEIIAKRLLNLKNESSSDNDFDTFQINKESAKFAVFMAQTLGFITQNCVWDWKGLSTVCIVRNYQREKIDHYLRLEDEERIIFFKYFLEADGAAMLEIGKRLIQWDKFSRSELLSENNAIITNAFIAVWEAYRILTTDLKLRMQLSSYIKELKAKPYTYKTLVHKAQAHLFPLVDIGLISREKSAANEVEFNTISETGINYLQNFINSLKDIEFMENRFSNDEYFHVYIETFNIKHEKFTAKKYSNKLIDEIKFVYKELRPYSPTFVSIPAISDVISARMINRHGILVERTDVEKMLDQLKIINTKDFHFHVDRSGRRNFLSITDSFLKVN